jgi:hypothetical protein
VAPAPSDGHLPAALAIGYKSAMAGHRRFDLEELTNRPGTYFNPQTEVLVVVDDSPEIDQEIFEDEDRESDEWVLIADAVPIDESARDELLERFQVSAQHGGGHSDDEELDEEEEPDEELEPDPLEDEGFDEE